MLPVPTATELADFTGRAEAGFSAHVDQALAQATLLFSVVTALTAYPDDADRAQLAKYAILEMADRLYLEQPYAAAKATPYTTETIGSYSYGKSATAAKARDGQPTGLLWWDLAVDELSAKDRNIVGSGSLAVDNLVIHTDLDGNRFVLGPGDDCTIGVGFDTNAERNPRPRLG